MGKLNNIFFIKIIKELTEKIKPKIILIENGPIYLINDPNPRKVNNLVNSKGEQLETVSGVALCRCGASKNKPFCDGTHTSIGFKSKNTTQEKEGKTKSYTGNKITIHDNRKICCHAAECVENLSKVFRKNERPWIVPDAANPDEIIELIKKCPSGALSYSIDGEKHTDYDEDPKITVSKNGPLLVKGRIEMPAVEFEEGVSKEHYTLCRCGASKNKPFCDGEHFGINFLDEKN